MTPTRLAYLLALYDLTEGGTLAGTMTEADLVKALDSPHDGDCTGSPAPCSRCYAARWNDMAHWVLTREVPR